MAVSRGQTPPVNLKERIAALQQRNVSPNTHQSAQATPRGLPSPGSGGLRDKIAKFEEKGGMPVPRGSFAMGVPQLAENAPPKKRGELYGNRMPGLGRPSGAPVGSRAGSPLPSTDDAPGPRKRCISTGAALSSPPPNFSTDEPVPALPNGLSGSAPRRNSVAVHLGSGRRVMSTSDVECKANASSPSVSSLVPEKPPDEQLSVPETAVEATPSEVEQPQPPSVEAPEVTVPQPLEPAPVVEDPLPADTSNTNLVDAPAELPPAPENHPSPLYDAFRNVSESPTGQSSKDELSEYESAPQSAVSQPSPSFPEPTFVPCSAPTDAPSITPEPESESIVVSPSTPSPEKVMKEVVAPQDSVPAIPAPSPERVPEKFIASQDSTAVVPTPSPMEPAPPQPTTPAPSPPQSKPTFKAVVHRKVTELSVAREAPSLAPPVMSQPIKQRRAVSNINITEVPPNLGGGDLAVLLEDAALLELRLTERDSRGVKASELLETTPTTATFRPDPRQASASMFAQQAPIPSIDSGSLSVRSMSIPSIREPLVDGEIPEEDETDGRSLASTTFSQRSPSHRKYLSNIYRLTSRRSSGYMPGSYPRDSMSLSSEDSSPVTTPSDNGKRKGFGIGWPSASPKKGGPNISRSSSFADKIFNRNRTKSNVSTADQASERNSLYESSQPNLTLTFPPELSPETHPDSVDITRPASWISPGDSNPEFSPASSVLDKDIFDAFPSVPQTLPPGFHLDAENAGVGRASTLAVNGRKQVNQRVSMA